MKKGIIISLILSLALCLIMPFNIIFSDGPTYYICPSTTEIFPINNGYNFPKWYSSSSNTDEVRVVYFMQGTSYALNDYIYVVSKTQNQSITFLNSSSGGFSISTRTAYTYNNETYYVGYEQYNSSSEGNVFQYYPQNYPYISNTNGSNTLAIRYTYGDLAVGESVDYGDLNISYSTHIAGMGNASLQNKDVLNWDIISSNGINISSGALELRLVPGKYTASSKQSLLSLLYNDFVIDIANAYYLTSIPISNTSFEMTWEEIIEHLDYSFLPSFLSIQFIDDEWIKSGWVWQYRIMIDGEYLDENYKTIYTSTSSGVQNSENIVNNNYNQTLQQTITNINTINNNTTNNNWYYQEINVPNYDPSQDDSSWLSTLIEVIGNLLNHTFNIPLVNPLNVEIKPVNDDVN